jgi:hypothetical protein
MPPGVPFPQICDCAHGASFRDNAKVSQPSLCCSVPSRPASSPGGLPTKAETLPLGNMLHSILIRLVAYVAVVIAAGLLFLAGATVYELMWPRPVVPFSQMSRP